MTNLRTQAKIAATRGWPWWQESTPVHPLSLIRQIDAQETVLMNLAFQATHDLRDLLLDLGLATCPPDHEAASTFQSMFKQVALIKRWNLNRLS